MVKDLQDSEFRKFGKLFEIFSLEFAKMNRGEDVIGRVDQIFLFLYNIIYGTWIIFQVRLVMVHIISIWYVMVHIYLNDPIYGPFHSGSSI